MTLAVKINEWRAAHPGERITLAVVRELNGGANLYGANLGVANLSRADLYGAYLSRADLSGANLGVANLSRADLYGAYLSRADLSRAYLSGANLSGANLSGANLRRANLRGADLSEADLSEADLYGANLRGANLSEAYLYGANLRGANLSEAYLYGAYGLTFPAGPSGNGWLIRLDSEGRATTDPDAPWFISIGCWRDKTLDDLRALINDEAEWPEATDAERERRRPYLRAVLALCEAHIAYEAGR